MEEHKHLHLHDHVEEQSQTKLAFSATLHCLLGCGIGEVVGIIIGTALVMTNTNTIILAVSLGFVFGFILGIRPLLKAGFNLKIAFKTVLIAEGLSIAVMEAGLTSWIFWAGMILAMTAGFIAAFPVNYYLIGIGVRHQH